MAALGLACGGVATAAPGDLDPSFGQGSGYALVVPSGTYYPVGNGVAIQGDGKIVVAGTATLPGDFGSSLVLRLLASGGLDPSFGSGTGIVMPRFSGDDGLNAVALQPDGKIVAAGQTSVHGTLDVLVVRLAGDGSLDTSYGLGTGASAPDYGGAEFASAVALAPDGKIVTGGSGTVANADHFLAVRFLNPEGTVDTSYGATTGASRPLFSGVQLGRAVALQPSDGKILVAGFTGSSLTAPGNFLVARFQNPEGGDDPTFGNANGAAEIDFGGDDQARAMVLQPDGKILVAGSTNVGGTQDFAVVRLLANGSPDNTFGVGGRTTIDMGGNESATAMALQPDGKIVLAGSRSVGTTSDMAVARLLPNGELDSTFGTGGKAVIDLGSTELVAAVALQPDGKIVLAGSSGAGNSGHGSVVVARLLGDPAGSSGGGGGGAGTGGGGGGGATGGRPTLRQLTIAPQRFSAAARGASAARARAVGGLVSYRLDIAASVRFSVQHDVAGRKQGHGRHTRCVAPSNSNGRAPRCRRIVTLGSFARSGSAGLNSFRFTGRVNNRKLAPGSYTLVAVPSANRTPGAPVTVSFQITR